MHVWLRDNKDEGENFLVVFSRTRMANTGSGRNLLLLCSQDGFYFCFLTVYKNAHVEMICTFCYRSGRTEEEVLKKAAERFNVAPEKITLKQGELSSYAEVNDFFEAFADYIEIMALLEISSVPENKTDHVLASWRHSMRSEDQGYLPFTWEIQKSRMENQIVRAIMFMFMHKISTRVIRVNGTCEHPWPRYFDGRKKEQFIPLLIS